MINYYKEHRAFVYRSCAYQLDQFSSSIIVVSNIETISSDTTPADNTFIDSAGIISNTKKSWTRHDIKADSIGQERVVQLQVGEHLQEEHDDIRAIHNDLAKLLQQATFEIGFEHILLNLKSTQSCSYRTDLNYSTIALLLLLLYVQRSR
ncbi:unnamed protein product [Rotaria socialis]|uniref:Uncharacterized protein n=1 Tax=Rotaria socialis TaxID=392032 RepID=A0A821VLS0_9BILA|nr:unnamed protein product [Rotaria socialis]